ncbi:hypothetical protein DSO57_1008405 [Entomophthora muscae]|uniref:Uncharacterized protein n=1 Tax=Entomophthora muscae TaxID=34485 RepID=A0ACC2TUT3_9FUNG|nr:hypothetical protein DSO57_1008405 [Entomophthora muscae]
MAGETSILKPKSGPSVALGQPIARDPSPGGFSWFVSDGCPVFRGLYFYTLVQNIPGPSCAGWGS